MTVSDSLVRRGVDTFDSEVAIVGADGTILYTNAAWRQFAIEGGFPGDPSMVGEDYLASCQVSRDEDEYAARACAGFEDLLTGRKESFSLEYPCPGPTEPFKWFLMWANQFTFENEQYVVVTHVDITDRKRAEHHLLDRNEVLASVATILNHDLRNPMAAARAWAELVGDEADPEKVGRIIAAIDRMDSMLDDAVVLARETTVDHLERIDVAQVAEDSWSVIGAPDATLVVEQFDSIMADGSLLRTIFENLLRNAVDHAGADVTIRISPLPGGFVIEDDGPGIPIEERENVFEVGYTTRSRKDNTGMGLAIVRGAVNAHEWSIALTDSESGGARFEITDVAPG